MLDEEEVNLSLDLNLSLTLCYPVFAASKSKWFFSVFFFNFSAGNPENEDGAIENGVEEAATTSERGKRRFQRGSGRTLSWATWFPKKQSATFPPVGRFLSRDLAFGFRESQQSIGGGGEEAAAEAGTHTDVTIMILGELERCTINWYCIFFIVPCPPNNKEKEKKNGQKWNQIIDPGKNPIQYAGNITVLRCSVILVSAGCFPAVSACRFRFFQRRLLWVQEINESRYLLFAV